MQKNGKHYKLNQKSLVSFITLIRIISFLTDTKETYKECTLQKIDNIILKKFDLSVKNDFLLIYQINNMKLYPELLRKTTLTTKKLTLLKKTFNSLPEKEMQRNSFSKTFINWSRVSS